MAYVLVLVVLAAAVYLISAPLLGSRREAAAERRAVEVAELEAARDAKYREIRDAELDVQTGKLSDDDYQALDTTLRAEAVDILHQLDRVGTGDEIPSSP
ncbi:MAG: hypothetical protein WBQ18_13570 [Solirubrobacteraceae bacterium]|jgi:hypothetical protein